MAKAACTLSARSTSDMLVRISGDVVFHRETSYGRPQSKLKGAAAAREQLSFDLDDAE